MIEPSQVQPGQRIKVIQHVRRRERDWSREVTGTVQDVKLQKTGSWYAHSKDDKYWLRRVTLKKDDGELTTLNLDQATEIELLNEAEPSAS